MHAENQLYSTLRIIPECYDGWIIDWLHGNRCSSPRHHLAAQLRYIRNAGGNKTARAFLRIVRSFGYEQLS